MIADCETCDRKQVPCKACEVSQRAICFVCQGGDPDPYGELPTKPRRWADQYGALWYLHRDGTPPHDDDQDYVWTGVQWAVADELYADQDDER
jgi:hypothetical protein